MDKDATLHIGDKAYPLNILKGTESEKAVDISLLRKQSKFITFDDGYGNTGSCESKVTFIDGDQGILRYRGFDITDLATNSNFLETAYLVIYGELPTAGELGLFRDRISNYAKLPDEVVKAINAQPHNSHPMGVLAAGLQALGGAYPNLCTNDRKADLENFDDSAALIISTVRTIAATRHRFLLNEQVPEADTGASYCKNFLSMMFGGDSNSGEMPSSVVNALDLIFLLHADHEQNASTSTVRLAGSSGANPYACVAAGIAALWGPAHGGANEAVLSMLDKIGDVSNIPDYIKKAKDKDDPFRLMGFGHRVYKNHDPRATVMRESCNEVLGVLGLENDPLFKLAKELERIALEDEYFVEKRLYPNVDFYSGIILKALGIPVEMFTVIFATGRTVGWIAHWNEMLRNPYRIGRPRQLYTGSDTRDFPPIEKRS